MKWFVILVVVLATFLIQTKVFASNDPLPPEIEVIQVEYNLLHIRSTVLRHNNPNLLKIEVVGQSRNRDRYYYLIIDHGEDFYSPKNFTLNNLLSDSKFKINARTIRVETDDSGVNTEYYSEVKNIYFQTPKVKPRKPYIKLESWGHDHIVGDIHSRIYVYDSDSGSDINLQAMPVDSRWRIYKDGVVPQEPNKVELSNSDRLLNQDEGAWGNEDEVDTEGQWRRGWRLRQTSGQFAFGHESPGEPMELESDTLYNIDAQMKYNSVDDPWGPMESIQVRTKATSLDKEYEPDPEPVLIVARTHNSVHFSSYLNIGAKIRLYRGSIFMFERVLEEGIYGEVKFIKGLVPDTKYRLQIIDKDPREPNKHTSTYEEGFRTLKLNHITITYAPNCYPALTCE